jgi:hypothetical protein
MKRSPSRTTIRLVLEASDPANEKRYDALSAALANTLSRLAELEATVAELQEAVLRFQEPELPLATRQPKIEQPEPDGADGA